MSGTKKAVMTIIVAMIGITIGIVMGRSAGSEAVAQMKTDKSAAEKEYHVILEQYKTAANNHFEGGKDTCPFVNEYLYGKKINNDSLYYAYYDLNNDKTPELLIGIVNEDNKAEYTIYDMFGIEGERAQRLQIAIGFGVTPINEGGEETKLYVCEGNVIKETDGDKYCKYYTLQENSVLMITERGVDMDNGEYYETFEFDANPITKAEYDEIIESYAEKSDMNWQPIDEYVY